MRTYANPVIGGFFPDPSVCRVGEDYYLVCSSFEYFPGVPIFHSRDLIHWQQVGNVLDRPEQLRMPPEIRASHGIWAPTLRHHDGRFYMITTLSDGGGHFVVSSERPEGPWSDPVWIDLPGVDPDLAWDEDGTCWCTVAGAHVARIDLATGKVLEGPLPAWPGTGLQAPEAPHLYRIGEWWYLLLAEGGTARGHCVTVARARSPRGPYEAAPANPILTHRSTDRPIQSTGHGDLVQAADGSWWMVLLGTRPRGATPAFHVLGRETFLIPVEWADGWPVAGPVHERHPAPAAWHPLPAAPARDDFDGPSLRPCWISVRSRPAASWSLTERPGSLTLHATGATLDRPGATFVGRRQQHLSACFSARLDPGAARAGLSLRIDEAHHYDLEVDNGQVSVIARIGPLRQRVAAHAVPAGPLTLTIDVRAGCELPPLLTGADQLTGEPLGVPAAGPDTVAFLVQAGDAPPVPLAEMDGRYVSTEVATGYTGRVAGMYVTEGTAHFDWFDYTTGDDRDTA
jgi:beta-xylosidase